MIDGARVARRLDEVGLSQSELARRVGVKQATVWKLVHGESRSSVHLLQIARELETTPAFLLGETDDPDFDAPPPPPAKPITITMPVLLPSEAALTRMFEGLLEPLDMKQSRAELARTLARRLPAGLGQLRDLGA